MGRKQLVQSHQPQDPIAADGVTGDVAQTTEDLAMAFAAERRGCQIGADEREQGRVIERGLRPALAGHGGGDLRRGRGRVIARPRESPGRADPLHP